jgi:hypothetical protein
VMDVEAAVPFDLDDAVARDVEAGVDADDAHGGMLCAAPASAYRG